ncbi:MULTISPECIES: hypothetical protein [Rhizobium]|uniref:hypothetical protein n=1 Tax=Rhizobium TaxID=379 RepID=UPI00104A137F|nr:MULTISPECIES: hypothetical protein [Rhizobium]
MSILPKCNDPKNIAAGGPGRFSSLGIWETKTARPAGALANNLPADNADNRFHGGFYGAGTMFGQVLRKDEHRERQSGLARQIIRCLQHKPFSCQRGGSGGARGYQ